MSRLTILPIQHKVHSPGRTCSSLAVTFFPYTLGYLLPGAKPQGYFFPHCI